MMGQKSVIMVFGMSMLMLTVTFELAHGLKIAFVGDSGVQSSGSNGFFAKAMFEMIDANGVDLIVTNGDLDYNGNPQLWDDFIETQVLDKGMEILVGSGNHETIQDGNAWFGNNGYKAKMEARFQNSALKQKCSGEYGERMSCTIDDNFFLVIGYMEMLSAEKPKTLEFMTKALNETSAQFKWCVFHRPQGRFNNGEKHVNEYGIDPMYEVCRKNGAVITSGHSHVYGRLKLMSSFVTDVVSSNDQASNVKLSCGETTALVVGMGGFKFDADGPFVDRPYWRSSFTSSDVNGDRSGALICDTGNVGSKSASCKFIITPNQVFDEFTLQSSEQCALGAQPRGSNDGVRQSLISSVLFVTVAIMTHRFWQ